jgi:hypothetical protein
MENIDITMASSLRDDDDYPQIYFRRRRGTSTSSTVNITNTEKDEKNKVEEDAPTSLVYLGGYDWLSGLDESDIAAWKLVMCSKWEPLADQSYRW